MTPAQLEFLLHCYYSPCPYPKVDDDKVAKFINAGIIEPRDGYPRDDYYVCTTKGKAFVDLILETDYPKQAWVDKDNKVLEFC